MNPTVKVSKNADMTEASEFKGQVSRAVPNYQSNKVTATGLEENTTYYYSYGTNGNWSEPVKFQTQNTNKFGFILVGDPQVGSSSKNTSSATGELLGQDNATRNDTFNWNNTIRRALGKMNNASFILSAGDQIQSSDKKSTGDKLLNYTGNEIEYAGYLSPDELKSLPVATTAGNHDAVSGNYSYHFNNPNTSTLGSMNDLLGQQLNGDYHFRYGNTLFIMLNTNNVNAAEHKQFIEQAVAANEDATWKVVTLHQDIYGSAEHSNETAIAELRYKLVPIFEDNNIDVVLTGHDHAYARTNILKGATTKELMDEEKFDEIAEGEYETGELSKDEEYLSYLERIEDKDAIVEGLTVRGENISNPDGILYITAGSSTGSKYYNNLIRRQSYIANRWQEYAPTFSTVNVDEVSLSISTYRTDTMELIDDTVTIIKSVEYGNLVEKIEEAEALVNNQSLYTVSTWEVFEGVLNNAQAAVEATLTEGEMVEIYGDLSAAMAQLEAKGDASELNSAIVGAEELVNSAVVGTEEGQYPQEAKDTLVAVIIKAKEVLASEDMNQVDIDKVIEELNAAVNTFKSKVNVAVEEDKEEDKEEEASTTTPPTTTPTKPGNPSNPSTGDNFSLGTIVVSLLSLVGICSVVYVEKRKKKQSA